MDSDSDGEHIADAVNQQLRDNVVFASVSIKRWRGQRAITNAAVLVAGEEISSKTVGKSSWQLMPETWRKRFSEVEHEIRDVISAASPKFSIEGVYVIPRHKILDLFRKVDALVADRFQPLVDEFVSSWNDIVAELKAVMSAEQFEDCKRHLPKGGDSLRTWFGVTKHLIPMAGGRPAREMTGRLAEEHAEEIERYTREFITGTAQAIADGLQDELREAVDTLSTRLDKQGVVQSANIDNVRRAFEKIRNFSFAATPELLEQIAAVDAKLKETDHQALNRDNRHGDGVLAATLIGALKTIREQSVADEGAVARFGRAPRSIEL